MADCSFCHVQIVKAQSSVKVVFKPGEAPIGLDGCLKWRARYQRLVDKKMEYMKSNIFLSRKLTGTLWGAIGQMQGFLFKAVQRLGQGRKVAFERYQARGDEIL